VLNHIQSEPISLRASELVSEPGRRRSELLAKGLAVAVVLTLALLAQAQRTPNPHPVDWPQWRGPTHDGSIAGEELIDQFPADGPPVLWIRDLGQGYSGLAVAGNRVFTMTQTLYEQQLVCLDGETGKTVWTKRIGWPYDGGGLYPGPRSTPTVVAGQVFYVTPQGVVGCARAGDGEIVWQLDFQKKYKGRGTEFGYSCSPLVIDDLVILGRRRRFECCRWNPEMESR
jgi:hypothetical protein